MEVSALYTESQMLSWNQLEVYPTSIESNIEGLCLKLSCSAGLGWEVTQQRSVDTGPLDPHLGVLRAAVPRPGAVVSGSPARSSAAHAAAQQTVPRQRRRTLRSSSKTDQTGQTEMPSADWGAK